MLSQRVVRCVEKLDTWELTVLISLQITFFRNTLNKIKLNKISFKQIAIDLITHNEINLNENLQISDPIIETKT